VFEDTRAIGRMGEVGVILLLFFVGMEVDLAGLVTRARLAVPGTILQVAAIVLCAAFTGWIVGWSLKVVILVGFAASLSSTALVVSLLRQKGELDTDAGRDALSILLIQDFAVIPMLMVLGLLAGESFAYADLLSQALGGLAAVTLVAVLLMLGRFRLPFGSFLRADHELQVFSSFVLCFGLSWVSGSLGLSTALGAFLAGIIVAQAREADWVRGALEPFRVLFVATFFVSVGMLIDLALLSQQWVGLTLIVLAALATKTAVNTGILRGMGRSLSVSLRVGGLLAQIGEFSFVLAAVGRQAGLIDEHAYQEVIGVIVGTLLLTPAWLWMLRRLHPVEVG
jgi:CPA2 family monovalent cation:H+ antiporter-2